MGRERATLKQASNRGFSRGFVIIDDPYRVCAREELNLLQILIDIPLTRRLTPSRRCTQVFGARFGASFKSSPISYECRHGRSCSVTPRSNLCCLVGLWGCPNPCRRRVRTAARRPSAAGPALQQRRTEYRRPVVVARKSWRGVPVARFPDVRF